MALKLENFGFEVVRGPRYQSLIELEAAMLAGEFDLSAVFAQDALTGFVSIGESPIFDQFLVEEIVGSTLGDMFGYVLLDQWLLNANYAILLCGSLAQGMDLSFGALSRYAPNLTLAATREFMDSPGGLAHMRDLFGALDFGDTIIVQAAQLYDPAQLGADVVAVRASMLGNWFAEAGFFDFSEGLAIWPANNFHPVVSESVLERMPEIRVILSSVSFQIDPARFAESLRAISQGEQSAELAAYEIMQLRR
jgi:glycine betaine/choline ABC-type transport system substrate-binding protein